MLAVLEELRVVRDAKRRHVDPKTDKAPKKREAQERLEMFFETEPDRLERWFDNLLGVYADAFGNEAAHAFDKAVRAWNAGIEVVSESALKDPETPLVIEELLPEPAGVKPKRRSMSERIIARLPVPKPLPHAVATGNFGQDENGKPVRPGAHEVRVITEQHADKLIDLLDSLAGAPTNAKEDLKTKLTAGITAYADDFGQEAAERLEAYVRREARLDPCDRADQGHGR
jgi:hypothetical protein